MQYFTRLATTCILMALTAGCGSQLQLNSHLPDQEIKIDGIVDDWQDALIYIEKKNVSVGLANDEDFLYLCLVSTDRDLQRQIIASGFTLWFDPDGTQKKSFGIKFPVGLMESGMLMRPAPGMEPDFEAMRENLDRALLEIELILPDQKIKRIRVADLQGIEVKFGDLAEKLIYEIKVPLAQTEWHPFAIGIAAGRQLGIGFETSDIDREAMREKMGRGGFGGGRGGFGGRRGGSGGGRRGGARPQMPSKFKMWVVVQLDSENQPASARLVPDNKLEFSIKPEN